MLFFPGTLRPTFFQSGGGDSARTSTSPSSRSGVTVPQIDISMERIYRFQFDLDRISKANHVPGIGTPQRELSFVEMIVVILKLGNMDKAIDEDTIEAYMKALLSHRGDDPCEPLPYPMAQPRDRPQSGHVALSFLGNSFTSAARFRQFQQGSGVRFHHWTPTREKMAIQCAMDLKVGISADRRREVAVLLFPQGKV